MAPSGNGDGIVSRAICKGAPTDNSRYDFGDLEGGPLARPSEIATALIEHLYPKDTT